MATRACIGRSALAMAVVACSSSPGSGTSNDASTRPPDATPDHAAGHDAGHHDTGVDSDDARPTDARADKAAPLPEAAVEAGPPSNATSADAFVDTIGMNIHLSFTGTCYDTGFTSLVTLMTSLGVRHVRDGLIDFPSPATYYDRLNQLGMDGIHSTLITSPTQTAALLLDYPNRVPDSLEAYESPNEPNQNEGTDWVTTTQSFQKLLYQTIKGNAATQKYPVLGPSITSEAGDTAVGDLSAYLDYGNMHNYFASFNPGTPGWGATDSFGTYGSIAWSKNIMAQVSGTKPILTTETGWGDGMGANEVPEAVKAKYVTRLFLEQYRQGVVRTIQYQFCDNTGDALDYGIVASDMTPKPAYAALKSLIGALADPGPAFGLTFLDYTLKTVTPDGGTAPDGGVDPHLHSLLFQKRTGAFELVLWLEEQGYNPNSMPPALISVAPVTAVLDVHAAIASATVGTIDDTGALAPVTLAFSAGVASVSVTDHVSIVELVPAK
jgi:hypothetical protein